MLRFLIARCAHPLAWAMVWLVVVGSGFWALYEYMTTPGPSALAPPSSMGASDGSPRLFVFIHPRCPCSRATIDSLAHLAALVGPEFQAEVLVYRPRTPEPLWEPSAIWHDAAVIPGVRMRWDEGGRQAALRRVSTSGQVLVYDNPGQVVFNGGITPARGHQGDNAGRQAVADLLTGREPAIRHAPVFGCPLVGDSACPEEGALPCPN